MADAAFAAYHEAARRYDRRPQDRADQTRRYRHRARNRAAAGARTDRARSQSICSIGASYTPNAIAMAQVSTQAKVPFFIVNAATSDIYARRSRTRRASASRQAQITRAVRDVGLRRRRATRRTRVFQDYGPGIDAGTTFEKTFIAPAARCSANRAFPSTTKISRPTFKESKTPSPT